MEGCTVCTQIYMLVQKDKPLLFMLYRALHPREQSLTVSMGLCFTLGSFNVQNTVSFAVYIKLLTAIHENVLYYYLTHAMKTDITETCFVSTVTSNDLTWEPIPQTGKIPTPREGHDML